MGTSISYFLITKHLIDNIDNNSCKNCYKLFKKENLTNNDYKNLIQLGLCPECNIEKV